MIFADFSNRKIVFPFCTSFGTIIALSIHHQEQAVAERIAYGRCRLQGWQLALFEQPINLLNRTTWVSHGSTVILEANAAQCMTANLISDSPEQCPSFTVEKGRGDQVDHPDPF